MAMGRSEVGGGGAFESEVEDLGTAISTEERMSSRARPESLPLMISSRSEQRPRRQSWSSATARSSPVHPEGPGAEPLARWERMRVVITLGSTTKWGASVGRGGGGSESGGCREANVE